MLRMILPALLMLTAPAAAVAACAGNDLRDTLSAEERAMVDETTAAMPYATGNHWIARRGGQSIHLIGTMHLDHPAWPEIVDRLRPVVEGADAVFVEMTEAEEAGMQEALARDPSRLFLTEGPTLPDLMEEDDWQRLSDAMAERGMPGFMVAKTQPWMLSMLLGIPGCAMEGGQPSANGLDRRLMAVARAADVPVAPLEGFEEVLDLFADEPLDEQLRLLVASLPMAEASEDQFATLTGTYFDEESSEAWGMTRVLARRGMDMAPGEIDMMIADLEEKLLIARNQAWLPRILGSDAETLVVAVGALHLSGQFGLAALLETEGFSLTRAPF
jgi:uncharacterized protein YbaP (TraB family)